MHSTCMNILVVGSGGREHALAWKACQSNRVSRVFVAPGNAGTASMCCTENVAISATDIDSLIQFARDNDVALTIVGPEAPLVEGICDRFRRNNLPIFGPVAAAARLEGSKSFAKAFMFRHDIPTAAYQSFTDAEQAIDWANKRPCPIVIKADGLAAGKGVVIVDNHQNAETTIREMLQENRFGDAGSRVVVEAFLQGEEASFICMVDGKNILPMASSQDHKAAYDGDNGPNTGGMGAYSPAPIVTDEISERILNEVIQPAVDGMAEEGMPYTGFLYAGLMIADDGAPNVVEFNCRFGDPEAQPVLSRLKSDLVSHCLAAIDSRLADEQAEWDERSAIGVVMAADGYPGSYSSGHAIEGLYDEEASAFDHTDSCKVFHSGTSYDDEQVVANGGRVLCVTAMGSSLRQARDTAYRRADEINWQGAWYRSDIGYRALARESERPI